MQEKQVYEYLQEHGIKPSVQRVAVMKYLLEHPTHPPVEEIYTRLAPKFPTLSKTTVYNTLKLLVDQGVVRMLTIDGKNTNYDGCMLPHAHFLCSRCGKIHDVDLPAALPEAHACVAEGFRVDHADLYYHGVCADCLRSAGC